MTFKKYDGNKPPLVNLAEFSLLSEVAQVIEYGANKYGRDNWRQAGEEDLRRYKSAMLRHFTAYCNDEWTDTESGYSHLAHAVCNLIMLKELETPK